MLTREEREYFDRMQERYEAFMDSLDWSDMPEIAEARRAHPHTGWRWRNRFRLAKIARTETPDTEAPVSESDDEIIL